MDLQNNLLFLDLVSPIPVATEPPNQGTLELLQAQAAWIAKVGITAPEEVLSEKRKEDKAET